MASSSDEYSTNESELDDEELVKRYQSGKLAGQRGASDKDRQKHMTQGRIKQPTLNVNALDTATKDIAILSTLKWPETLTLTNPAIFEPGMATDDLKRENMFYDHALDSVREALPLLKKHNISHDRPHDYYAEMLKTDEHMQRVKQRLLGDRAKIEASERARKQRDNKKFGKKVQQEVQLRRQREKSSAINEAAKHRKGLKQQLDNARDAFDVTAEFQNFGDGNERPRLGGKSRSARDAKFGFGGKRNNSRAKKNDSSSFGQGRFNPSIHGNRDSGAGKKKAKGAAAKRPGKARRQKMRNK